MSKNSATKLLFIILSTILLGENISCTSFISPSAEDITFADSLYNKGVAYENKLYHDSAFICYKQAIELLEGSNEYKKLAMLYNRAGEILSDHKYYPEAIETHWKAAIAAKNLEDKSLLSKSYRRIGRAYGFTQQLDSTFHYYSIAKEMLPLVSYEEQADIYNNMAALYLVLGKYDSALYYNEKSLGIYINEDIRYSNYSCRGKLFKLLHQYDSAKHYYKLVMHNPSLYSKTSSSRHLADIAVLLGEGDSSFYKSQLVYWNDSLDRVTKAAPIGHIEYNLKIEKLKKEKSAKSIIAILLIFTATVSFVIFIYKKLNNQKLEQETKFRKAEKELKTEQYEILKQKKNLSEKETDLNNKAAKIKYSLEKVTSQEEELEKRKEQLAHELQALTLKNKSLIQKEEELVHMQTNLDNLQKELLNKQKENQSYNIERERELLKELSSEYEIKQKEFQQQKESFAIESRDVYNIIERLTVETDRKAIEASRKIAASPTYRRLKEKLTRVAAMKKNQEKFSKEEQLELTACINTFFEKYFSELKHFYSLTDGECLICAIEKLGLTTKQCCIYMDIKSNGVRMKRSNAKKHMRKHICGEKLIKLTFKEQEDSFS